MRGLVQELELEVRLLLDLASRAAGLAAQPPTIRSQLAPA